MPDIPTAIPIPKQQLRPPGALPEEEFQARCKPFCDKCLTACPRNAIIQDSIGFPVIQPEDSPCVMCLDVPCTKVCPTGALIILDNPREIAMGIAVIDPSLCRAHNDPTSLCRVCYDICPISEDAIRIIDNLPQIIEDQCTGCGLCLYACPEPGAISINARF